MLIAQSSLPLLERFILPVPFTRDNKQTGRINRQVTEYLRGRLAILFNASGNSVLEQHKAHPYAADSVLNFGVVNLAGTVVSGIDTLKLAKRIRRAILRFEPRINSDGLIVSFTQTDSCSGTSLNFTIEGEVDYQHEKFAFSLNSHWNTDSGEVQVLPFYPGTVNG